MTVTTYQTVTIPAQQLGGHVMLVEWLVKQQQQLSVQQRLIDQQQQLIDQQKQQIAAQQQEIEQLLVMGAISHGVNRNNLSSMSLGFPFLKAVSPRCTNGSKKV